MPIIRIPLSQPIESRIASFNKDSYCSNGYFETRDQKREFIKRPGLLKLSTSPALPEQVSQGLTEFNGYLYAVVNNTVYRINPSGYGTTIVGYISGTIKQVSFAQTLDNGYLFMHNETNGYLLNGSTGAFTQITNDVVAKVTILTGGDGYSEGVTATFSGGSTTATGTVEVTSGSITAVTVVDRGSGYVSAPTITFTKPSTITGATVVNTTGTNIMTTTNGGAFYVGMTVTGTGVPANTTITEISGTSTKTFTLSNTTTSAVTTATFTDEGNGATATAFLNFFPDVPIAPGAIFLDQYIFVTTTAGRVYSSNVGDAAIWDPLDYITAEGEPDNVVGCGKHLNYIITYGEYSTEFFYDAANPVGSPLANAQAYRLELGCASGNSIVQFEQSVAWIGVSKANGRAVFMLEGTNPIKVSSTYIDRYLNTSTLSKVRAYAFKYNGHMFYVLSLFDLNVTLVYDVTEKVWYRWSMFSEGTATIGVDGVLGEQLFRPAYYASANGTFFVLDSDNSMLYALKQSQYTDDGAPIYYRAVTDIQDSGTTKRKFYQRVEIIGDKVPATMMIRHSEDDYNSWSNYRQVNLNAPRSQIYGTGQARRRAWEFLCTDPAPLRLDSAEIDFQIGEMEQDAVAPPTYRN